ncbi:MAG: hypothetical protein V2J26_09680 [Pacificimonas sp.]|jgi:hypothetical protein|nr:hypothetical protein [Pacificimonas sp.]
MDEIERDDPNYRFTGFALRAERGEGAFGSCDLVPMVEADDGELSLEDESNGP